RVRRGHRPRRTRAATGGPGRRYGRRRGPGGGVRPGPRAARIRRYAPARPGARRPGRPVGRRRLRSRAGRHAPGRRSGRDVPHPAQLDSLLGRLDAVVSTRLHGLVLSLRARIPVVAVDPVLGGGKVTAQARAAHWPALIPAAELLDDPVAAVDPWLSW